MIVLPITAIIPTFNRTNRSLRALSSIYFQTQRPAQIIVVDDGSTEPIEELKELLKKYNGVYIYQPNCGVSVARNLGVAHATQDWIAFLDSDDEWLPTKLEKQFQLHQQDPTLVISHTTENWFRNGLQVKQKSLHRPAQGSSFERCLEICCISASAVIIKKCIFEEEGGFDRNLPVCEDYDLWIRLARKYSVGLITEPLVNKYRGSSDQLSESVIAIDRYRLQALLKLCLLDLKENESKAVLNIIEKKLRILKKGAEKKGLIKEVQEYETIREKLSLKSSY